jgi:hypothetical protein
MGVKRSPRNTNTNTNSYNNFYDGGSIIKNYVRKTLNPTYIKPISSAKGKRFSSKPDQGLEDLSFFKKNKGVSRLKQQREEEEEARKQKEKEEEEVKEQKSVVTETIQRRSPRLLQKKSEAVSETTQRRRSPRIQKKSEAETAALLIKKNESKEFEEEEAKEIQIEDESYDFKKNIDSFSDDNENTPKIIRNVKQFVGIMNCKDIKKTLELNSWMTIDQKIDFINQNSVEHREFRAYVYKQHWGVKDLTAYFRTATFLQGTLSNKIEETVNYFTLSSENTDPDCQEIENILKELKAQKNTEEYKSMVWKSMIWLWDKMTSLPSLVISGISSAVFYGYKLIKWLFESVFSTGFKVYNWIREDPKMAKYTLITLKLLKRRTCKIIGSYLRTSNTLSKEDFDNVVRNYKVKDLVITEEVNDKKGYVDEIYKDALYAAAQKTLVKSLDQMSENVSTYLGSTITTLLGGAVATGAGVAAAATAPLSAAAMGGVALVGWCVTKVVKTSMEEVADAAEDAIELGIYVKNSDTCFGLFFELVDPRNCLKDILLGYKRAEWDIEREALKDEEDKQKEKQKKEEELIKSGETVYVSQEDIEKRKEIAKRKKDEEEEVNQQYNKKLAKASYLDAFKMRAGSAWNFLTGQKNDIEFDDDKTLQDLPKDGIKSRISPKTRKKKYTSNCGC